LLLFLFVAIVGQHAAEPGFYPGLMQRLTRRSVGIDSHRHVIIFVLLRLPVIEPPDQWRGVIPASACWHPVGRNQLKSASHHAAKKNLPGLLTSQIA